LLEALVAEAEKHPSFEFRRGVSVREVLRESGRATGVRVHDENREERIPARLVIGTDGRSSVVRRDSGIPVHADAVPIDIVWCKFPPLPDTESEMPGRAWVRGYLGNGHLLLSYVTYDGQVQVGWIIFKGGFGALRRRGMPQWVEEMAHQTSPDLAAHFRRHRDQITHPFLLDTASDRVRTWSAPGMLLLGDAAHTMSPVGGQGINVGLRDTIVAANHLLPALRRPDDVAIENACRAIEAERVDEITKVQRLQALPPRLVFGTAWWARGIRRLLPHLVRRSFVQQNALKQLGAFFRGTTDVRLEA
jgi:2-polyprenyl-6-methoxyphenol hydroxylase-like FAD-dependent oxidoreductase